MKTLIISLLSIIAIKAHASEQRVYQSDSMGNMREAFVDLAIATGAALFRR